MNLTATTKILAIGYLPPPIGGLSVSFEIFCKGALKRNDVNINVINLAGNRFVIIYELIFKSWKKVKSCDAVLLHCATPHLPTLGLFFLSLCRIMGKPMILRKAASYDHRSLGRILGRIAELVAKYSDLYLVQTKKLYALCRNRRFHNVEWIPTTRQLNHVGERRNNGKCKKIIYVGQVCKTKGIKELIDAAERMPTDYVVDVYGPPIDGFDLSIFENKKRIRYRGLIEPNKVQLIMFDYDAFVIPTKANTEGYPGAIIEAYSVGLPVIATTVGGIPEIVEKDSGILISPGEVDELYNAMYRLYNDVMMYNKLCEGVIKIRERFSASYWNNWLIDKIIQGVKLD